MPICRPSSRLVELDGTHTVSGTWGIFPFSTAYAIGHSQLNVGWTAGAGIEGALAGNWTWKAEYLYVDLGSLNDSDRVRGAHLRQLERRPTRARAPISSARGFDLIQRFRVNEVLSSRGWGCARHWGGLGSWIPTVFDVGTAKALGEMVVKLAAVFDIRP